MHILRLLILAMVTILSSLNLYPATIAGNTVAIERTDDPVLRFVVCGDIHMKDTADCNGTAGWKNCLSIPTPMPKASRTIPSTLSPSPGISLPPAKRSKQTWSTKWSPIT